MRRLIWLAPLLLLVVGCGVMPSSKDKAMAAAREVARKANRQLQLSHQYMRTAEEVGRSASLQDGVTVLRVTGTSTYDEDGIQLVLRTSGSVNEGWLSAKQYTVYPCFTVRVSRLPDWDKDPQPVDCPDGPPLVFSPLSQPPRLPYKELHAALPRIPKGGQVDESEVRRSITSLYLDPSILIETKTDASRVGVLLLVPGNSFYEQSCLLARVAPGATEVWTPPRAQRIPDGDGCTIGNALNPKPLPH
ncbi:translation initiation factor IF-2 [Streptomyces filamentosus]|uniref:translation initiation factor IF-2 n=1 Tax=Streptomyces filamentosus TaxID=67294 RepID=UPI0033D57454